MKDCRGTTTQERCIREGEATTEPRDWETRRLSGSAGVSPFRNAPSENSQAYHVEWFVADAVKHDVTVHIRDRQLIGVEDGCAPKAVELGQVAWVNGLVNAHTHLEFSNLTKPIPASAQFTDWIRAVIQHRREHPHGVTETVHSGFRESVQCGTTLLADIATIGWSTSDYINAQVPSVVFQEVLGLSADRIVPQKEVAQTHFAKLPFDYGSFESRTEAGWSIPGISPHAPYSTHGDLVHDAVRLAIQHRRPIAMHVAETTAELELLEEGQGEFRDFLMEMGLWRDELFRGGVTPLDYLQILSQAPQALVIHGNYLNDRELQLLASHPNMTLVYCPRTHAAFGHSEHPWRRLRELGGRVAIGTDSRASNPDLSLFAELQFLAARNPDVSHVELLQLGSIEGRRALGVDAMGGANFTLIRLSESEDRQPDTMLFGPGNSVCGTMIEGQWAWLADKLRRE